MGLTEIMTIAAAVALVVFCFWRVSVNVGNGLNWRVPAAVCLLFLAWSLWTVVVEGPTGFWPVHSQTLWGNQVWFDLLIAVGIGWFLILPRARAQSMNLHGWLILILMTGCIGFLAMVSRMLFLETQSDVKAA